MAIIPQKKLFVWDEIEKLEDLDRLRLVIEYMPDEALMRVIEKARGKGRNDFPVRAMWNAVLAGIVYQHPSIASLCRELARNGQLRQMCGFEKKKIPPQYVFTRFCQKLFKYQRLIDEIFNELVETLRQLLPDFGKHIAIDSKAINSLAKHKNKNGEADGRRDKDADYGAKQYKGVREDGTVWEKVVSWFGYKLHLIVDATYELPVAFEVTKASASDVVEGRKLVKKLAKEQPGIIEACEDLEGDRGYDDTKLITELWDEYKIKPVIDIRNMWKDGEETKVLEGWDNITYNYKGNVYCHCKETGTVREMCVGGFEEKRNALKKVCPVERYGIECKSYNKCPVNYSIRIDLETDRRIFTPVDRASNKWQRLYNKRTTVERVNSRLDVSFGFERHYIRGIQKMKFRSGIALCVMLAMAVGRIKENQMEHLRSLVKSA